MANCNNTLEYSYELLRMCSSYRKCRDCPLNGEPCHGIDDVSEKYIEIVQKWSDEHPELKPCPICGATAEVTAKPEYGDALFAHCTKFGCIEIRTGFGSYQQAAEAWNQRTK